MEKTTPDNGRRVRFLLGFCFGSLVGAAAAVLTTPLKGEDARDLVIEKAYRPVQLKLHDLLGRVQLKVKANPTATKDELSPSYNGRMRRESELQGTRKGK